jgi:hypothetical protein
MLRTEFNVAENYTINYKLNGDERRRDIFDNIMFNLNAIIQQTEIKKVLTER